MAKKATPKKKQPRKNAREKTKKHVKRSVSDSPSNVTPLFNESMLSQIPNFGHIDNSELRAVDRAQQIMYDAWEAPTSKRAVALAKKALDISADCADAYILLAQETAMSLDEMIALYRKGVEAGERALGKEVFVEDVGHFWGLLETRPYMRARANLAQTLWDANQREESIEHYRGILKLNPSDNQGIRYLLLPAFIELGLDADAETLYKQFEDDFTAFWMYSRALLDFRKHGESPIANESLQSAILQNKYVPSYILGRKRLPATAPSYYGVGDVNEAILYASENIFAWRTSDGAKEWLTSMTR